MARLTPKDRLQPSLLERLTAPRPGQREEQLASVDLLRESVRRELGALFSATSLEVAMPMLGHAGHARRSSLNFGISALSGRTASSVNLPQLERQLTRVIRDYEPRLSPGSVRVRAVGEAGGNHHNTLCFEVEGELWAQPLPQRLLLRMELDLESGQVRVEAV